MIDAPAESSLATPREIAERVREIAAEARGRARQTERDRRVPDETIDALGAAGFFRIPQPRVFGGGQTELDTVVEHIFTLAAACPSTGWVAGLFAAHQWLLACFGEQAQHDVLDVDPDARICGSYAPTGQTRETDGGYLLSGRWSFASGSDTATWAVCASFLPAEEGARGKPAFFLIPAADYTIDDDWDVAGLSGTGSKTLVVDDAFVPAHRLLPFSDIMAGTTEGAALHADYPALRLPMLTQIPTCLAAVGVGAAAGALADFQEMAGTRQTRGALVGGGSRIANFATVQLRVAEAAASVDAAKEILLRDIRLRAATAREGRQVSPEERILSRRGQAFAVALSVRAVEAINGATGGQGLAMDNPIQRAWRDVSAVSRHISLNWDAVGTMSGQAALGLPPQGQY
ncbi:acyl-CoA dehydrogenase family protein [Actinocorallia sp. A-T 12471]|uniref:acyl-CoA dehydrogenase family protein n=1 Tax=Actinocorallia sp. A-T 12471 TaxID=3089813 RepID=UPI0029D1DBF0|nr:acyl-CoA dehydrogenase family protein [Actinocorallia sp. A-T 12471]MDX6744186.1 acyl-CoA dehydrogenase family protein [Actinocorallia sp. A-T 12471]